MIADLKPYLAMKDSGVPSLGNVPEHWHVRKLRHILRRVTERNQPDLLLLSVVREKGVIRRDTTNAEENRNFIPDDLSNYKVVRVGQFAMNKMKAWQGSYGVSPFDGIVSPAYFVFHVTGVEGLFFHSAIRSRAYVPSFTQASDGVRIGQWDLAEARMREIAFVVPPLAEQDAIVRFLGHANRRIERYIRAKKKLIALLNEQKHAIIHRAVTRGLDPNVRLKPSGIPWLGEIPEHWSEIRLKFLARKITDGEHISPPLANEGVPLLSAKDIRDRKILYEVDKYVTPELAYKFWQRCRPERGDFLIVSRGATIGRVALVESDMPFCLMGSVILCKSRDDYAATFLYYALNTHHAQTSLWFASASSAQQAIYIRDVAELRLLIPPFPERENIVRRLEESLVSNREAIDRSQREISFLREYRTRLIVDVVTGKIDVREAAAKLPEEPQGEPVEPVEEADEEAETSEFDGMADSGTIG
ncbi:MAG: restriction endonuclease subunit S [Candidatus Binatia bacterium]